MLRKMSFFCGGLPIGKDFRRKKWVDQLVGGEFLDNRDPYHSLARMDLNKSIIENPFSRPKGSKRQTNIEMNGVAETCIYVC